MLIIVLVSVCDPLMMLMYVVVNKLFDYKKMFPLCIVSPVIS